ncbi:MAG: serine hydroxymethyltransferase [Patescibacteria group bacterium]
MAKAQPTKIKKTISRLIQKEIKRQEEGLVMIPSENYTSPDVLAAMGSPLSNKYSEGYPQKRYYTGNQYIDQIEEIAQQAALHMFGLDGNKWHANVQPHSGSSANLAVYLGLLKPGDKILGLDLSQGGHLSHGHPVNFSGKLFKFVHYGVEKKTEKLDYKKIEQTALREKPKMIVCGATAYPRTIDFKKFSLIAKKTKALLVADVAHIVGLIIAGVHPSPFPYADVVTSTTHKTLAGPRSAFIISKIGLAKDIDRAIFPGLQGGPLENMVAAKAICFAQAQTPNFRSIQKQTIKNSQVLAQTLIGQGLKLVTGGSDNHLMLINCLNLGISGKEAANILAEAGIYTNFNMIPFDPATPFNPSGLRLGTPALSTRGMKEKEMKLIGLWIAEILKTPQDTKKRQRIAKEVVRLTKKFPFYKK